MKKSIYSNEALDWYFNEVASGRSQFVADHILHQVSGNKSPKASRMLFNRAVGFRNKKNLSKTVVRAKYYAIKHGFDTALI